MKIIEEFVGLITTIPITKKDIINDYKFFNFSILKSDSSYILKDTNGFTAHILEQPIETVNFGHVAFKFRLKDDSLGRKEYVLSDSIKAIFNGKDFILVLNSMLYDRVMAR